MSLSPLSSRVLPLDVFFCVGPTIPAVVPVASNLVCDEVSIARVSYHSALIRVMVMLRLLSSAQVILAFTPPSLVFFSLNLPHRLTAASDAPLWHSSHQYLFLPHSLSACQFPPCKPLPSHCRLTWIAMMMKPMEKYVTKVHVHCCGIAMHEM
jgi:hypothetical protein